MCARLGCGLVNKPDEAQSLGEQLLGELAQKSRDAALQLLDALENTDPLRRHVIGFVRNVERRMGVPQTLPERRRGPISQQRH